MPMIWASKSVTASANSSGEVSTPRSWTTQPAPRSIMMQRFLPMSWRSPLTVPMTDDADGFDAGGGEDGFEVGHAGLHGACGDEDFGHEDHVVTELDADDCHAVEESVVEDVVGGVTLVRGTL